MAERKFSERKLILFTVGLLIFAGIVRLISYRIGVVFFYLAFGPFLYHRIKFYYRNRVNLTQVDKYRKITLIVMLVTICLNIIGLQDIEFFLLFILAIDYLIIVNAKKTSQIDEK
ncbi:hypothetical protein CYCD_29210 [Tenuifilaceae bacterium CYCD]|nr:hypothetical protein CYCD_29210 [Tenuifilaceae bacterium CYCD]